MHNKEKYKLENIPSEPLENVLIADENKPGFTLKHKSLKRSLLTRLGMKQAVVHDFSFYHCIFQDCYFRSAKFSNVNFTGSTFKDCNLRKATFEECNLWYVQFSKCWLSYDAILQSIPTEPNIAILLLRSLRQNAIEMGEKKVANKILLREIEIEKQELKNQFCARTKYYKDRYGTIERVLSFVKFLGLKISGLIWGYGLRLQNLIASALLGMLVFAYLIYKYGAFVQKDNGQIDLSFVQSFYLSVITFTTLGYGDFTPASFWSYFICASESCIGIIFLGFLAASVYRKYAR